MGDRLKEEKETIIAILFGIALLIVLPILINFIHQKIDEYQCDNMSITEAWKDDFCREYFKKDMKEQYETDKK